MTPIDTDDHGDLRRRLRALRTPRSKGEFQACLHQKLVAAGPPHAPGFGVRLRGLLAWPRAAAWPVAGMLAGAFTFLVLSWQAMEIPSNVAAIAEIPAHSVPSSKVAVIKLNFSADVAVDDAVFEVILPEGLAFWSSGQRLAERSFRWNGRLDRGDNLIPIAVRGDQPGTYRIVTRVLLVGQQTIEHEVMLAVVRT